MVVHKAVLKRMRELTKENVPFSFEFLTHNSSKDQSRGVRYVERALLRSGFHRDQSDYSEVLIHFTDLDNGQPGIFYAPLLFKFNDEMLCSIKL
ncbi:hypothetical protein [Nonlabens dokdonensis]|uniref:hypothetical protein n=1 Tax=Nonlabens dokdonensis TaxID=328515 RepID=UPI0026F2A456|nr:hypothetical protein [Nonlabens dokdonensis]